MADSPKKIIIDTDPGIGIVSDFVLFVFFLETLILKIQLRLKFLHLYSYSILIEQIFEFDPVGAWWSFFVCRWCYGDFSGFTIARVRGAWINDYFWECLYYSFYKKCVASGEWLINWNDKIAL